MDLSRLFRRKLSKWHDAREWPIEPSYSPHPASLSNDGRTQWDSVAGGAPRQSHSTTASSSLPTSGGHNYHQPSASANTWHWANVPPVGSGSSSSARQDSTVSTEGGNSTASSYSVTRNPHQSPESSRSILSVPYERQSEPLASEAVFGENRGVHERPGTPYAFDEPHRPGTFRCRLCGMERYSQALAPGLSDPDGSAAGVCLKCSRLKRKTVGAFAHKVSVIRKPVPTSFTDALKSRDPLLRATYGLPLQANNDPSASGRLSNEPSPVSQINTCVICTDDFPYDNFLLPTPKCAHEADYCRQCMQRMIASDLDSKGWDKIQCPDTKCKQKLSDADVLRHAPGKLYDRQVKDNKLNVKVLTRESGTQISA